MNARSKSSRGRRELAAPPEVSRTPSTTGGSSDSQRFRVTHPFHPLSGREYEMVGFAHTWGEHRVFFHEPGQTRVRSLPAIWTDVVAPDPFVVLAAGRSYFRPLDLLELAHLLSELNSRCKQDSAVGVRGITPASRRSTTVRDDSVHVRGTNERSASEGLTHDRGSA